MALIDKEIYVGRADLLKDVVKDAADWNEALPVEASTAEEIVVLGGYYSSDGLLELCRHVPEKPKTRRKTCRIRIAVGLEGSSTLPTVWSELKAISETLRNEGFGDVSLGVISRDPVHFHTKLFGFVQDGQPVWFIGSANPGSKRHELMVRINGGHRAITRYAEAALNASLKVTAKAPAKGRISSLRDFFLAGALCHRPPTQRLFTFDAFRFRPNHRAKLNRLFAEGAKVTHAQTRTEGFGFGLARALGPDAAKADDDSGARHVSYAQSAVDTALGFWMPNLYQIELQAKLAKSEAAREHRLSIINDILSSKAGSRRAFSAFNEHVRSMADFLAENNINARPIDSHVAQFERFLERRRSILGDKTGRRRHARLVILTPMPNIWDDDRATRDFEESFFADLAYRAGPNGGNKGRVIKSLVRGVSGRGHAGIADDMRAALIDRLNDSPWTDSDWIVKQPPN
jgi:hypothetical protein